MRVDKLCGAVCNNDVAGRRDRGAQPGGRAVHCCNDRHVQPGQRAEKLGRLGGHVPANVKGRVRVLHGLEIAASRKILALSGNYQNLAVEIIGNTAQGVNELRVPGRINCVRGFGAREAQMRDRPAQRELEEVLSVDGLGAVGHRPSAPETCRWLTRSDSGSNKRS